MKKAQRKRGEHLLDTWGVWWWSAYDQIPHLYLKTDLLQKHSEHFQMPKSNFKHIDVFNLVLILEHRRCSPGFFKQSQEVSKSWLSCLILWNGAYWKYFDAMNPTFLSANPLWPYVGSGGLAWKINKVFLGVLTGDMKGNKSSDDGWCYFLAEAKPRLSCI